MRHVPCPSRVRLPIVAAITTLLLSGCGGGGGGGGSASPPAPTASATTPVSSAPTGTSTALKDNTPLTSANFSNFASGKVRVPVESVAFVGARRFVKVARADGATLFLGEVAPGMPFSVTVDAPNGQRRFNYEIFSESASDAIVRGEVNL